MYAISRIVTSRRKFWKGADMFRLGNDGYSMTFQNGYTVSVRWHQCIHYIADRTLDCDADALRAMATDSVNAEVAVIHEATGEFLETPFNAPGTVFGWRSPDQVSKIMAWARELSDQEVER